MFIDQYSYNFDAEPKRADLEALRQKNDESFSTYVGRWRAMAAQMRNKIDEEEQIMLVAQSAHPSISGYLMSQTHGTFQSLIKAGSHVESAVKSGKLIPWPYPVSSQGPDQSKLAENKGKASPTELAEANTVAAIGQSSSALTNIRPPRAFRNLTPLAQPYREVLNTLVQRGLLVPLNPRPPPNPLPKSYDPQAHCAYHQGPGHHTDRCLTLKHAIQDLVDQGKVVISNSSTTLSSNILHNTLFTHSTGGPSNI